jgi:hypothetical protein
MTAQNWTKTSQRTVKCRTCGVRDFYVYTDGRMSELRDRDGHPHTCTASVPPLIPIAAPQVSVSAASTATPATPQTNANANSPTIAYLRGMIPEAFHAKTYVPRRLNGKTDLEVMVLAFKANRAHAQGSCLPECDKNCKRRPINVRLISGTGAGKNHLFRAVAATLQVPYVRFILSSATVDSMLGRTQVREINGAPVTEWQDGRLSLVCRPECTAVFGGAIVFFDELNTTPYQIQPIINALTDDERLCIIDDHSEAFKVGAGVMFVGAMNPDYAGTRTLNAALSRRFSLPIELDYEEAVEKKLIKDARLLKLAKQIRQQHKQGDGTINTEIGTGHLLDYEQNAGLFGTEIANAAFVAHFEASDEKVAVRQALDLHMSDATPINIDADVNLDDA